MKFKDGDKIRMTEDCTYKKGNELFVRDCCDLKFSLCVGKTERCIDDTAHCPHQSYWQLVTEGYPCEDYTWGLKSGDLVDISPKLKNYPDFENWDKEEKEMAGQKGLEFQEYSNGDCWVYTKDKEGCHPIPLIYVKRHVHQEPQEMTLKEVCNELGRNVKIIKEPLNG